jgi:hypothetical protein
MRTKIIGVPGDGIQRFTQNRKTESVSWFPVFLTLRMLTAMRTIIIAKPLPVYPYARPEGIAPLEFGAEIPNIIEPEAA